LACFSGNKRIARLAKHFFVKQIYLPLTEPVSLVGNLVGLHTGKGDQFINVYKAVFMLNQLDVGINDSAVVKPGLGIG
jgi:hypothetical protein